MKLAEALSPMQVVTATTARQQVRRLWMGNLGRINFTHSAKALDKDYEKIYITRRFFLQRTTRIGIAVETYVKIEILCNRC